MFQKLVCEAAQRNGKSSSWEFQDIAELILIFNDFEMFKISMVKFKEGLEKQDENYEQPDNINWILDF